MLIGGPLVVLVLTLFLRRSRYGLAMRCAAANSDAARLAGISSARMSSLSWAIAGSVSAFTAMLVFPARRVHRRGGLRAEPAPARARRCRARPHDEPPRALAAGIGIGIVEQLLVWNYPRADFVEVALFVIIVVALLLQRGIGGREDEKGSWVAARAWKPALESVARLPEVRYLPWAMGGVALAGAIALPARGHQLGGGHPHRDRLLLDRRPVGRARHGPRRAAEPRPVRPRGHRRRRVVRGVEPRRRLPAGAPLRRVRRRRGLAPHRHPGPAHPRPAPHRHHARVLARRHRVAPRPALGARQRRHPRAADRLRPHAHEQPGVLLVRLGRPGPRAAVVPQHPQGRPRSHPGGRAGQRGQRPCLHRPGQPREAPGLRRGRLRRRPRWGGVRPPAPQPRARARSRTGRASTSWPWR